MNVSEGWGTVASKMVIATFLVLGAVAAAWTGINAWRFNQEKKAVKKDAENLKEIEKIAPTVQELESLGYTEERLREERRTGNWTSFFASTAGSAGFTRTQYKLPIKKTTRGRGFLEHAFEVRLNPKTGVTRLMVSRLLWLVESRRTYLKTRELDLKRVGESEDWAGTLTIAYREKP